MMNALRGDDMALIEHYLTIKNAHIGLAVTSGSLFALRGAARLVGASIAMRAPVRYLSYAIDTALLTAAILLLTALRLNPFEVPWLMAKLGLLVVYVVLGTLALKRGRTPTIRVAAYFAALLCFITMYSIARLHDPAGFWRYLM
ncbi:MAG: SirB2 family protein [Rhodocyclaceae bacterium]